MVLCANRDTDALAMSSRSSLDGHPKFELECVIIVQMSLGHREVWVVVFRMTGSWSCRRIFRFKATDVRGMALKETDCLRIRKAVTSSFVRQFYNRRDRCVGRVLWQRRGHKF